ncbi:unnamed protein product [Thelazia callipaeda]|uniref:AMP-binding domain-containing protein n=1 Tax=Thelazia callipaeda TaxID=103827 RepID=A0A0N5D9I9_THECL|nr:unnamed protein product [Thelazia callipaeda]
MLSTRNLCCFFARCSRKLRRWCSTSSNNITYRMGLNPFENHANQTAIILNCTTRLTYGDLSKRVGSMVALLQSVFGIDRGDRVLCRLEKSIDSLILYLAVLRLGAIYVPLNPVNTLSETIHVVANSDPHLFVSCSIQYDNVFTNKVEHVIDAGQIFRESEAQKPDYGVECVKPDDIACICYTSGTTGLPKGAMLSHGGLTWNAETLVDAWQFTRNDILLHMLPFCHVHGLFISLNCTFFSKSSMVFRPKFDVNDALNWLPQCTVMMGIPTYFSRLMQNKNFDKNMTKKIRLFVCGSAPLSTILWEDFRNRTGHEILERYGMTEANVITTNLYNDRRQGFVGKVLPGGKIRTTKEGSIQIQLPSLFLGYWKNENETRKVFTEDGFFDTGDIGRIEDDGFLSIQGRAKDLIISGGLNVYPKEVEDAIDSLPYVVESAVIGVPHRDLGEAVVALCVPESGIHAFLHESEAICTLRAKLANYKVPKRFLYVDELPRNSMGKVLKNVLKQQCRSLF